MSLGMKDFASMRLPLFILAVVVVISAMLIRYSSGQLRAAESERDTQVSALREAKDRYDRSGQERDVILRYLPAYRKLQSEGLVGEERRIEWVESLRAANKQAGLFGIAYQLDARKPYVLAGQFTSMGQQLQHSEMKISFGLMHEGDLMRFLDTLIAQHSGLFMIRRCTVNRPVRTDTPAPRQANLTAECELSWLTIEPKKG